MNSKNDLNDKFISFLDQTKNEEHKEVTRLNDRVLIIDGLNTFIRGFAVNPAMNDDGLHIGGLIGFLRSVRYTCDILKPSRCIIVFDGKGGSPKRRKIYPEYKANRKVKSKLNRNVDWGTAPQDEQVLTESDIFLMSTDKDFLQLVDDRVKVWSPTKKKLYTKQEVEDEYGIPSNNILTYRILDGDKSDNIGGIPGCGIKSIIKYLEPITDDKDFGVMELFDYVGKSDKKIKLLENIKNSVNLVKRNYLLMQLNKVDIPGHVKLKVQEAVHRKIPQLIKHRFQVMFLQDKLSNQIKNLDSWIMEFTRLSRFRGLDGK